MQLALYAFLGLLILCVVRAIWSGNKIRQQDTRWNDPRVVTDLLREADEGEDFETRQGAVLMLGKSTDPRAVKKLATLLFPSPGSADPKGDDQLRFVAVDALGQSEDPAAIEPLARALGDVELAESAAVALARIDGALPKLVEMASAARLETRVAAVRGLAHIPGDAALAPLEEALRDRSKRVRHDAAEAFGRVASRLPEDTVKAIGRRFLVTTDKEVRAGILRGISRRPGPASFRVIRKALGDEAASVRLAAVQCLGRYTREPGLGHTGADMLHLLSAALRDSDGPVREAAVSALSHIRIPESGEEAKRALRDPDSWVRCSACLTLVALMYEPAKEDLLEALGDTERPVRQMAARALGKLRAAEAAEGLIPLLDDPDSQLRLETLQAIGKIWEAHPEASRAAGPKLEAIREGNDPLLRSFAEGVLRHR
jgi:HEAT repeat protein